MNMVPARAFPLPVSLTVDSTQDVPTFLGFLVAMMISTNSLFSSTVYVV